MIVEQQGAAQDVISFMTILHKEQELSMHKEQELND